MEDWISKSPVTGSFLGFLFNNCSRLLSLPNFICVVSGSSCMDIIWLEHYPSTSLENDNYFIFHLLCGCPTANFESYWCQTLHVIKFQWRYWLKWRLSWKIFQWLVSFCLNVINNCLVYTLLALVIWVYILDKDEPIFFCAGISLQ